MKFLIMKSVFVFTLATLLCAENIFENKPSLSLEEMTEKVDKIIKIKYDLVMLIPLESFGNEHTKFKSNYYVFEDEEIDKFMNAMKVAGRYAKPLPEGGTYYGLIGIVSDSDQKNSRAILYVHSDGVIILDDGATKFSLDKSIMGVLGIEPPLHVPGKTEQNPDEQRD